MVIDYSPVRAVADFMGWQRSVNDMAQGLLYGVQNPGAFVKSAVDWDTWVSNPDRAFGRLLPDIVAAVTTAGAGGGASAATRAAGALGKAAKSVIRPALKNPLDAALRHNSNAAGRAWARDNLPLPNLSPEELRALSFYGGSGYLRINPALRAKAMDPQVVWSPDVSDHIAAMDQAIARSPLPSDVVMHRGVDKKLLDAMGVDIKSPEEMESLEGAVITEPGYLSTSVGRRGEPSFP
ncbi:ADP-ribosyltransferase [Nonomuraea endophytica]|uniref:ADP-ribosyltransferase n=1 Tax=Nonomuraea endophytica TaxID=714136 RepID=UPI0037C9996C